MGAMQQMLLASSGTRLAVSIVIAVDTQDYILNTAKVTGYVAGLTDVTLTIASGYYVGSTTTGSAALTVDTSWNVLDTVKVTVESGAIVYGRGGVGGLGGAYPSTNGSDGGAGGTAIRVQRATTITNNGTIGGGGGGGGGGGAGNYNTGKVIVYYNGDGGGGAQGYYGGDGGAAPPIGSASQLSQAGNYGNNVGPGTGGNSSYFYGGNGGSLGANGSPGNTVSISGYTQTASPGAGGTAGLALIGKSFVNSGSGVSGTVYGAQT